MPYLLSGVACEVPLALRVFPCPTPFSFSGQAASRFSPKMPKFKPRSSPRGLRSDWWP